MFIRAVSSALLLKTTSCATLEKVSGGVVPTGTRKLTRICPSASAVASLPLSDSAVFCAPLSVPSGSHVAYTSRSLSLAQTTTLSEITPGARWELLWLLIAMHPLAAITRTSRSPPALAAFRRPRPAGVRDFPPPRPAMRSFRRRPRLPCSRPYPSPDGRVKGLRMPLATARGPVAFPARV